MEAVSISAKITVDPDRLAQSIIETVREPFLVLDSQLNVRVANRSYYRTFIVSEADVENRHVYSLGNGEWNIPRLRSLLGDLLVHETFFEGFEVEHTFESIGRRIMLLNARRIIRDDGEAPLILLAIEDITDRRFAEQQLQIHIQKLEWSNRELQDFAYIASHDLQEPLRAIQAFGERLKVRSGDALNEETRDYLERMLRAATRMRVLIHDLLEFSRVTTKARPFVSVDLNVMARQALADLSNRINETEGRIEIGDLPTIMADATQMRQLLQNLIDNALKYRREDFAPIVTVTSKGIGEAGVNVDPRSKMIDIVVADNGIGFEQQHAERIFSPFQRLHGRGRYEGTGIGLAICRKIVERHGGRIDALGVPGQGSKFTVQLPMEQSAQE